MPPFFPLKADLSIKQLGHLRFGLGLGLGFFSFLIVSCFLICGRVAYQLLSHHSVDWTWGKEEWMIDLFLLSIAYNHALGTTLWFWFSNFQAKIQSRAKRHLRLNLSYNVIFSMMAIWLLLRFFSLIQLFSRGTIVELDRSLWWNEYLIFILLFPLVLFCIHWNQYKNIFHCNGWILTSGAIGIIAIPLMSFVLDIPQKKINQQIQAFYLPQLNYLQKEIEQARQNGIFFQQSTVRTLKEVKTVNSSLQVEAVKKAFYTHQIVALDTLILEKIMVHNRKEMIHFSKYNNRIHLSYIPIEMILDQIRLRQAAKVLDPFARQTLLDLFYELTSMIDSTEEEEATWDPDEEKDGFYFYHYQKTGVLASPLKEALAKELAKILQE